MATRKIIADSATPIRRLILSRTTKQSHANAQDRLLPLVFNPNQRDRLLCPIWLPNQVSHSDVPTVVQDLLGQWFAPPACKEQTRMSARGRQIPAADPCEDEDEDEDDRKFDERNDFHDDIDDDNDDDFADEKDDYSEDWDDECDER